MRRVKDQEITSFIEDNIPTFHERRLGKLQELRLSDVLKRKNPYLFKAKAINTAQDLVRSILDAHLSSQEEGIFGDFLEPLAIFVCSRAFRGLKSSTEGIDLEFVRSGTRYAVSIKSGPNWGNSRQIAKMKDDFNKARRILGGNRAGRSVAVNGCCYGKDDNPNKGDYFKYCGQRFWELISGDGNLYLRIIGPLGHSARQRNDEFNEEYARVINRFTLEFARTYCKDDGEIDWNSLLRFNSAQAQNRTQGRS